MNLKQLDISGFKSFGKAVTLEFSRPITAIVGPNGSGKSNVSEAIRWALGEQSMKSLRGKRGEDLIFHGSGSASQLGKASVKITFDNSKKIFPLDFEEVVVSREVYRDGVNEYKLNGTPVRLKDIVELLSNVGIGGSGHYVISQGEADRILYASPKERRNMLEDALGLRIYQIKKADATRKLESTRSNMEQVEALRREIQPHMRFLKTQADKFEASNKFREELRTLLSEYSAREEFTVTAELQKITDGEAPYEKETQVLEEEIKNLRALLTRGYDTPDTEHKHRLEVLDGEITRIDDQARTLERELGRIEGHISFLNSKKKHPAAALTVSVAEVKAGLTNILTLVDALLGEHSLEAVAERAQSLKQATEEFLMRISKQGGGEPEESVEDEQVPLLEEQEKVRGLLESFKIERAALQEKRRAEEAAYQNSRQTMLESERVGREKEENCFGLKTNRQPHAVAKERLTIRLEELAREREEVGHVVGDIPAYTEAEKMLALEERESIRRHIQRLRLKLEEAGGIDESVLREYQDISGRDQFLSNELEDLAKSEEALAHLMDELDQHLERDFFQGIEKINKEFELHFKTMFGGGSAALSVVEPKRRGKESEYEREEGAFLEEVSKEDERGIEISVDLPRKRVKSLDMLSGGERALTSIALLFAVSSVTPPPFLVLDETDAALDEANSQRYGAMLSDLSKKSQLCVVTPNRQTMKEAEILYGVTMGADGISRLLSIKFDEATQMSGKAHE